MLIQKRKNSLLIRLSVIGLVFCFLAYSSQCIAKEKVIKIGVLASFTGAASDVESLWVAGIKKAVEEINYRGGWKGIPIETRVFEAGGKPELTYVAAQKMIYNESVNIILGPLATSHAIALSRLVEKTRTILITPAESNEIFWPNSMYTFRIGPTNVDIYKALAIYASDIGKYRRAALVTSDRTDLKAATLLQKQFLIKQGLHPVYEQVISPDQTDFFSLLAKIRNSNADILYASLQPVKLGILLKQIHELGLRIQTIDSSILPSYKELVATAGPKVEGHLSVGFPDLKKLGYDSVYLLFDAFTRAGTYENTEAIRKMMIVQRGGFYDWGGPRRVTVEVVKFTSTGEHEITKDIVFDVPPDPPWKK